MHKVLKSLASITLLGSLLFTIGCARYTDTKMAQNTNVCPTKQTFTVMWSIYAGWMPWPYAAESGILDKWGCKYGIKIKLVQADYVPSIEAYVAGQADGVVMTNMDAVNFAGTAGVDSTAIILGDFSNGSDAVITRNNLGICDLKGKEVNLVQFSVSHYLLARGLEEQCAGKTQEKDLRLVNVSDSDISSVFIANKSQQAVVTWNPMLLEILSQAPEARRAFDSSKIPDEILDLMFLRTKTAKDHPELARALTGAWFETLALMKQNTPAGDAALRAMAERGGSSLALYKQQLETTNIWYTPAEAVAVIDDPKMLEVTGRVADFSFRHGLLGPGAKSAAAIGVALPDGKVFGEKNNIQIRFTDEFMKEAAAGKL